MARNNVTADIRYHALCGLYWINSGHRLDYTFTQLIRIVCVGVYLYSFLPVPSYQREPFRNLKYWESQSKWCALQIDN